MLYRNDHIRYGVAAVLAGLFATAMTGVLTAGSIDTADASACLALLREALHRHHAAPDSGKASRRVYRVRTISRNGAEPDTTTIELTVIASRTASYVVGRDLSATGRADFEMRSDQRNTIRLSTYGRTLQVIDLRRHRKLLAAQQRLNTVLPDSLLEHSRIIVCSEGEGGFTITLAVDSSMTRFYNADTVTAGIDRDHHLSRLAIAHPPTTPLVRTEYEMVERIDDYEGDELDRPAIETYFSEDGRLRSAYAGYHVVGRNTR